jgi:hypothetical protein
MRDGSPMTDSPIAILRSHVAQAERLVARQKALIEKMALPEGSTTGEMARTLLAVLEVSLRLAREHLIRHEAETSRRQQRIRNNETKLRRRAGRMP